MCVHGTPEAPLDYIDTWKLLKAHGHSFKFVPEDFTPISYWWKPYWLLHEDSPRQVTLKTYTDFLETFESMDEKVNDWASD